ncbi:LysR family transcriptional regulator [Vibrio comitans]|uniref:LysR family transcriptional regulator n=1 Tax=Vibrio comitans NBRC 102076 TaxID=1219078 RepID=A0A4Y3IKC0_9VIBR|nr:LysR family transcriptional regulator [Vibrio comitans]GEA59184.1 LysR family transcriptional regulator [Vibrio comitans NBRC 102076]
MNFSIEQLQAFVAVYEERSFSKAAASLNKHRSTTGQVIVNLEDILAVELFERIGRTVEPTKEGKLLYHYAKIALEQSRVFDKIALSLSYGGLEEVTFAYPSVTPHRLLSSIRAKLAEDFPNLTVNFIVRNKAEIEQGMREGEIHFGLVMITKGKGIYSVDSTFLGHMEFLPFVKKGGELSKLPASDVLNALRTSRQFMLKSLSEEGFNEMLLLSAKHDEIEQLALIIKMIQDDLGWAWLPKVLTESQYITDNLQALDVDQLKNGIKFSFALWNPHSKQVIDVKSSIMSAVEEYIAHFNTLQS